MRSNKARYPHGNYQKKILELTSQGKIDQTPGTVTLIDVKHDTWCNFFKGGSCNCQPEIVTQYERGKR